MMHRLLLPVCALMLEAGSLAQGGGTVAATSGQAMRGIRHIGITVSDIDATLAFYAKAVPYQVVARSRIKASSLDPAVLAKRTGEVEIALVEMPTMFIQLLDIDPDAPAAPVARPVTGPGYTHICFQSPATASAETRFRAAGLQMVSRGTGPVDLGGYGVRYSYGRDPDGIMIENEVLDAPKRQEAAWVTHIANVVHDRDAMLAFYSGLLTTPPHRTAEQENRPTLDAIADIDNLAIKGGWFRVGNMELEVWQFVRPATPLNRTRKTLDGIGYNSIGFEVRDIVQERQRLQALGVALAGPLVKIAGWSIQFAHDPEGNLFSVQQHDGQGPAHSVERFLLPAASPAG